MQERDLFIAALEIDDPAVRQEYLDKSCADDPALRGRIERLLNRVTEMADFLDQPAADLCALHRFRLGLKGSGELCGGDHPLLLEVPGDRDVLGV